MSKIKCPKCRGTGQLSYDIINLFDFLRWARTEDCDACFGKGWIYA